MKKNSLPFIITASSIGTLIEWYDFYIFGMLSSIISTHFFNPSIGKTASLISTLAIFAVGFLVRPFGALFFGRLGDIFGRKFTFLLTLIIMGLATCCIGLIPSYNQIGFLAPLLLLFLRLLQGLALGGEYGGAATFVAEHSPKNKRGFWTSWIQTTASLGLFLALIVIISIKKLQTDLEFAAEWGGWRYPFYISALLIIISFFIRWQMEESPLFAKIKADGKISKNPLAESFKNKENLKIVLVALFGATMGQGVIFYTSQFYVQYFLENVCHVEYVQNRNIMLWAILLATPFYIIFGYLSDIIGRKWIMLGGMFLALLFYRPIYGKILTFCHFDNKNLELNYNKEIKNIYEKLRPKYASLDPANYNRILLNYSLDSVFADSNKVNYSFVDTVYLAKGFTNVETNFVSFYNSTDLPNFKKDTLPILFQTPEVVKMNSGSIDYLGVIGFSQKRIVKITKVLNSNTFWKIVLLIFIQVLFTTMVYGPIAAYLIELFPTKIRYTSMSLPYHLGNGVFGGLVPFMGAIIVQTSQLSDQHGLANHLNGLNYSLFIILLCFIVGTIYLGSKNQEINED